MLLADELINGTRPHPRRKRPGPAAIIVTDVGEDIDGSLPRRSTTDYTDGHGLEPTIYCLIRDDPCDRWLIVLQR
jgi:hypothetical protein